QQTRNREHWANAHLIRLAAGYRKAAERTQGLEATTLSQRRIHQHAGRCAVGELTGVARGDAPSRHGGLDLRHPFESRVRADDLVAIDRDLAGEELAAVPVGDFRCHRDGNHLGREAPRALGDCGALLAAYAVLVLTLA